jgi:hypothetical protein
MEANMNPRSSIRSSLEALEHRRLFAGNVSVSLDASTDTIQITGDAHSNAVLVTQVAGNYVISGQPGTTINGGTAPATFPVTSNLKSFLANLGNGHDRIWFQSGAANAVGISTGKGDDRVTLATFSATSGNLSIETGFDDDRVTLGNSAATRGNLNINTGKGDDRVSLTDSAASTGSLSIATGVGTDDVSVVNTNVFTGNLIVETSDGSDDLLLRNSGATGGSVQLFSGEGADDVRLDNVQSNGGNLEVRTGAGDDAVALANTIGGVGVTLDGGNGFDTLTGLGSTPATVVGFELIA